MKENGGHDDGHDDDLPIEGEALWAYVAKSVKPLPGREPPVSDAGPKTQKPKARKKAGSPIMPPPPSSETADVRNLGKSREVDRRTAEKLRRGRMKIEARLDLHGMGRVQAYDALRGFLQRCYEQDLRHVLVITGKGLRGGEDGGPGPGILRQRVPQWLDEAPLRDIVLQYYNARRHHGGEGALYILLRRKRAP